MAARFAVPKLSFAAAVSSLALVAGGAAGAVSMASCEAPLPVWGKPGTNQERTFLACKPDAVQRGLVGEIIARFETRGECVCMMPILGL